VTIAGAAGAQESVHEPAVVDIDDHLVGLDELEVVDAGRSTREKTDRHLGAHPARETRFPAWVMIVSVVTMVKHH